MRRADPPSMDPGRGEWRPNDMRLWTKDELLAEIGRLAQYSDALEDQVEHLRRAIDDAVAIMRDARGHYGIEISAGPGQPPTEWDEIADRMRAFVYRYDRSEECPECGPVGGDADCPRCNP